MIIWSFWTFLWQTPNHVPRRFQSTTSPSDDGIMKLHYHPHVTGYSVMGLIRWTCMVLHGYWHTGDVALLNIGFARAMFCCKSRKTYWIWFWMTIFAVKFHRYVHDGRDSKCITYFKPDQHIFNTINTDFFLNTSAAHDATKKSVERTDICQLALVWSMTLHWTTMRKLSHRFDGFFLEKIISKY